MPARNLFARLAACARLSFRARLKEVSAPFLVRIQQKLSKQTQQYFKACLYGLAAGLSAVAFQLCITFLFRSGIIALSHRSFMVFALGTLGIMVGSSLIVGFLLNSFCPEAAGSGIPQVKLNFWKDFGVTPLRVAWVKFIAGVASVGGGASMGREGPSVQLAAAVSSNLAGLAGEAKQNRRTSSAAGAAAGLAAAFNAPLAATTFVLEEIIGDLNSRLLGAVILAAVLGALVVHGIIGKQPAFTLKFAPDDAPSWKSFVLTPIVAAVAAIVGVYFQRFALGVRKHVKGSRVPGWLAPVFGGLITWALGVGVFYATGKFGVFGLGYVDLSTALSGQMVWNVALTLLVAKFVATFCCYGFGGCGGIFSPCLFFGGMVGLVISALVGFEWHLARPDVITLAVVGMSATLGSVVGAPVTGILIVFEMTHEFSLVPALMLGALVSQTLSRKMNPENFYDELLTQDGHQIEHVRPPRDLLSWQQLPVAALPLSKPVSLTGLTPVEIQRALKAHPYRCFPVILNGKPEGILARAEGEAAIAANRRPKLEPPATCRASQTIRDLQSLLIASTANFVVVTDDNEKIIGVFTLHDLLRAEVAKAAE